MDCRPASTGQIKVLLVPTTSESQVSDVPSPVLFAKSEERTAFPSDIMLHMEIAIVITRTGITTSLQEKNGTEGHRGIRQEGAIKNVNVLIGKRLLTPNFQESPVGTTRPTKDKVS